MLAPLGRVAGARCTLALTTLASVTMISLITLAGWAGCEIRRSDSQAAATGSPTAEAPVARGKYLVNIAACNECHTPWTMTNAGPAPDMTRMLSGHPAGMVMPPPPTADGGWIWFGGATNTVFAGPWGVSYASNLTPHTTGLSAWNEEIFIRAMRTGRHMGTSRPILPPMPWPAYKAMTDADLKAIWAYLQSIPQVENQAPESVVNEAMAPGARGRGAPGGAD